MEISILQMKTWLLSEIKKQLKKSENELKNIMV